MRAIVFLVGLLAFAAAPLTVRPAAAQTAEQTEIALRDFGLWAREIGVLNADTIALYETADALNDLVDAYVVGEKDERTAYAGIEAWRHEFSSRAAALRARQEAIPIPRLPRGFDQLEALMGATTQRMRQAFDQSDAFADGMVEISRRGVSGELDQQAGAMQRAYTLARQLVEFDNGSLALRRAMSPAGHPSRPLADATIVLNTSMLIVFEALVEPEEDLFNDDQRRRLRASADDIRRYVADGRVATRETQARIHTSLASLSPEMRAAIGALFDSLLVTFDTLSGAAEMLEEASRARGGKDSDPLQMLDRFEAIGADLVAQGTARATMLPTQAPTL